MEHLQRCMQRKLQQQRLALLFNAAQQLERSCSEEYRACRRASEAVDRCAFAAVAAAPDFKPQYELYDDLLEVTKTASQIPFAAMRRQETRHISRSFDIPVRLSAPLVEAQRRYAALERRFQRRWVRDKRASPLVASFRRLATKHRAVETEWAFARFACRKPQELPWLRTVVGTVPTDTVAEIRGNSKIAHEELLLALRRAR